MSYYIIIKRVVRDSDVGGGVLMDCGKRVSSAHRCDFHFDVIVVAAAAAAGIALVRGARPLTALIARD